MDIRHVLQAWGRILAGRAPSMSIEITRECPLRCPGCYAYEDAHLGGDITLRQLSDFKGDKLVQRVLELVDRERPLHLSIVGGDPLVRYRELDTLLPQLVLRKIFVQVVTSAFRPIPAGWATLSRFHVVVSIDGLQPEHDQRRWPATYERILKNIKGHRVVGHCTITSQMMKAPGYLGEFLAFWSPRPEIKKIWMSMFTPQRGANPPECLSTAERSRAIVDLLRLRSIYPKLDMACGAIQEFSRPPQSPEQCIFARTTKVLTADLKTRITPCQFGGDPDCSRCGCVASMGLAAVANHRLGGLVPLWPIFSTSAFIGEVVSGIRGQLRPRSKPEPRSRPVQLLPDSSSVGEM
jgi:MoaA/NifB/PqqE/SkfB family radical SAM enzyme